MQMIYKQTLQVVYAQALQVPVGASFLCVQVQDNAPQIWYECNPENDREARFIETNTTGSSMSPLDSGKTRRYIGTYQLSGGRFGFVGHVYEVLG